MKYDNRALNVLLIVCVSAIFLVTMLFFNPTTRVSVNAGDTDPTKAAYLPLVIQQATFVATPNPNNFETIEFDSLSPERPVLKQLAVQQAHLWPILFAYNGAITITAVAEPTVDLVLEIINPANKVLQQANNGGSGELEALVDAQLDIAQEYKIRVYDLNGSKGHYCLVFSEGGGFPDQVKGRIEYGQTKEVQVEVLGIDYWCFLGANGDNVSLSVSAMGNDGDFVLGLFSPPDFEAVGTVFVDSEIMNANLLEDGLYIIGVLDLEATTSGYSITLTKN